MGNLTQDETHVERSSSMSFALRWKHDNLRYIIPVALVSCVITLMFLVLLYGTSGKQVAIVVDGQETIVQTKQWELGRLLDEQAIQLGEHDLMNLPLTAKLKDGQRIVIDRAMPIRITADGATEVKYTTEEKVENALQDLQISLGVYDKTVPGLEETLKSGDELRVIRVNILTKAVSTSIPFETEKQDDNKLAVGKQNVLQEGKEGVIVKKMEQVYEDGVLVSESLLDETVQAPSVNKVIAVGTKKEVSALSVRPPAERVLDKGDINFTYKEILNNVQLTAYTAAEGGKKKSDPHYGMTASGTKATEGRTIAVDPSIVPLGWWVYIEGIGFRRAEDTGGAIKGKIMDIYYENQDYVNRFGRKRGFTVYVIGPKKPAID